MSRGFHAARVAKGRVIRAQAATARSMVKVWKHYRQERLWWEAVAAEYEAEAALYPKG